MKRLLGDLPLATKLLLASFLTLAAVIVLTWLLVVTDHQQESKVRLLTETALRAELTAYNAAPAMAAGDRSAATRVLASFRLTDAVLQEDSQFDNTFPYLTTPIPGAM